MDLNERTPDNFDAFHAQIPDAAWMQLREFVSQIDTLEQSGQTFEDTFKDKRLDLFGKLIISEGHFQMVFDWMRWREGEAMVRDPRPLESADAKTCIMFLSAIIRAERFTMGIQHSAMQSGAIQTAARRLYELHLSKQK
ncbi:MAG: DUF6508 domain-containing protein [Bacteroidota bacterium]